MSTASDTTRPKKQKPASKVSKIEPTPWQKIADSQLWQEAVSQNPSLAPFVDNLESFVGLPEGEWEHFEKLEQLRALEFGYRIKVVLTAHDSVEVDTREELSRVEELINGNG